MPFFSKFIAVFSRVIAHLFGPLSAGFDDPLRVWADTFPKPARLGMVELYTRFHGHWRGIRSSMCAIDASCAMGLKRAGFLRTTTGAQAL